MKTSKFLRSWMVIVMFVLMINFGSSITASNEWAVSAEDERAIGILIWNTTTMNVLPLNYNLVLKCANQGQNTIVTCSIPKKEQLSLRGYSASLIVDLELIESIALH